MKSNVYNKTSFVFRFITLVVAIASAVFLFYVVYQSNIALDVSKTQVGSIYLGDVEMEEFPLEITKGFVDWKQSANYQVTFQEYEMKLDPSLFKLDLTSTIDHINLNQINLVDATVDLDSRLLLEQDLTKTFHSNIVSYIDLDRLIDDLLSEVAQLHTYQIFSLTDYLSDTLLDTIITSKTMGPINSNDLTQILMLESFTVPANSSFSILNEFQNLNLTNTQMSIIASATKTLIQHSNIIDVYSHPYESLPEWASVGSNVRILKNSDYDLTFYNPNDYPIRISMVEQLPNSIQFELRTYPYISTYQTEIFRIANIAYDQIVNENPSLSITTPDVTVVEYLDTYYVTKVVQVGVPGSIYEIYRETTKTDGTSYIELFEKEYYRPQTEIVEEYTISKGE